ncbi:MAG: hypothetical protein EOP02_35325, partial [Proteobacteria bacterium]
MPSGRLVRAFTKLACCGAAFASPCLSAAILTFENYQTGDINAGGGTNTGLTFPNTNQDGWSNAAGSRGIIAPGTLAGLDGQFLTVPAPATAGNNITMIAAREGAHDLTGQNTVGFDLRFAAGGTATATSIGNGVAFLNQLSGNEGTFSQNADTGMYFGQLGNGGFGVRSANFGASQILFSTTGGAGIVTIPQDALAAGNWYRVNVSITELFEINPGEMGRTVSMSIFDYANQVSWGTNTWNASDTTGFGGFNPEDALGIVARVQRNNANDNLAGGLDNINITAYNRDTGAFDAISGGETAVCNLGSIMAGRHFKDGKLDKAKLRRNVA